MAERKLATIRKISDIRPIEGADNIELAIVNGWNVVVAKDVGHSIGDLVVYCEIDSFLPIKPEFEFLRKTSYKKMGEEEGFRLKTIKLRGQVSQGLILPISVLEGEDEEMKIGISKQLWGDQLQLGPYDDATLIEVGVDVSNILGIVKYEPPIPACLAGVMKGNFPSFLKKTDEERIQNLTEYYESYKESGVKFYSTEKLDGSSATFYFNDGEFGVCSRNMDLVEDATNTFWKTAIDMNLESILRRVGTNVSIQGELIGEGVQGNPYKIKGQTIRFFNLFDIDKFEFVDMKGFKIFMEINDLETVPILDEDFKLPDTIEELIEMADGMSVLNKQTRREGLVIRSHDRTISFKVISNKFLLKQK